MLAAVGTPARYIGLLGSRRKTILIAEMLREHGVADERIRAIRAPVGLDLGGRTPAEIALSVMAEITKERYQGTREGAQRSAECRTSEPRNPGPRAPVGHLQCCQDLRFGARLLLKDRSFALTTLLTLAVCIGANAAIFSIVRSVLLRPLPVPQSDRLVVPVATAIRTPARRARRRACPTTTIACAR